MAKLFFRYGSMNSGKTALLLQSAYNYEERGMKVAVFKPVVDTKGEKKIISRIGLKRKIDHLIEQEENIFEYVRDHKLDINCIFIDEAQFLKKEQVDQLMKIVVNYDIPVICYGIRTDFRTNGFEGATRLLEIAHQIEEMKTICKCGRKAMFNLRRVNGVPVFNGNQIEIDNNAIITYEPLCPNCYYKYQK